MLRSAAAASLLFTPLLTAQGSAPNEAAFDKGFAGVQAATQKAKWSEAREALRQLLASHERQLYVLAQRDAIAFEMQTCCFYQQARVPRLQDLLKGEIVSYVPATGRIKLRYGTDVADWEAHGDLLVHPLVFAGNYSFTVSGKAYPPEQESLTLYFDLDPDGDTCYLADFGFRMQDHGRHAVELQARVSESHGEKPVPIAEGKSTAQPGEPFMATVKVGQGQVDLLFDKKSMLRAKRRKGDFGQVGYFKGAVEEIVLEGTIEPAWLEGRIDEELAKQRETFAQSFQTAKELPAWLFEQPKVERTQPKSTSWVPGLKGGVSSSLRGVFDHLDKGEFAAAQAALAKLGTRDVTAVTRDWLDALLLLRLGRAESAEPAVAKALAAEPDSSVVRALRASVLEALGRPVEALAELQSTLAADPGEAQLYEVLCPLLLRLGRQADAAHLLRDAKVEHGLWDDVGALDRLLAMAQRGPAWPRRFLLRSTHYEVTSDIDAKVCARACSLLEESYVNLMAQFAWVKEAKDAARFRVFVFSGEAGYQEYTKAIVGAAVPHTAGLYSPVLKQLLIWNLPQREDMERTIRHEGFHQFLDRVMADPPSWFNEGLAEFWERAQRENGRFQGGQIRAEHIATLIRSRSLLPKLEQFVYGTEADFYANAQLRYAQAWALVHFLRKGPPIHTTRFQALWEQLRQAKSTRAAVEAAFAGVDWPRFEQAFWDHIATLKR